MVYKITVSGGKGSQLVTIPQPLYVLWGSVKAPSLVASYTVYLIKTNTFAMAGCPPDGSKAVGHYAFDVNRLTKDDFNIIITDATDGVYYIDLVMTIPPPWVGPVL